MYLIYNLCVFVSIEMFHQHGKKDQLQDCLFPGASVTVLNLSQGFPALSAYRLFPICSTFLALHFFFPFVIVILLYPMCIVWYSIMERSAGRFIDEKKAQKLKDHNLPLEGNVAVAGRTDKGVTALKQVCSFCESYPYSHPPYFLY